MPARCLLHCIDLVLSASTLLTAAIDAFHTTRTPHNVPRIELAGRATFHKRREHGDTIGRCQRKGRGVAPYFGDPSAPVVLLALNPGVSSDDFAVHRDDSTFQQDSRASLAHKLKPYPFLHLAPGQVTPGAAWWRSKTRVLQSHADPGDTGLLSKRLFCLELHGYHSKRFGGPVFEPESQLYSFHLLRKAMKRKAVIIVMRSWRLWSAAVPELGEYPSSLLWRLSSPSPQNPTLTPANLKGPKNGCEGLGDSERIKLGKRRFELSATRSRWGGWPLTLILQRTHERLRAQQLKESAFDQRTNR